MERVSESQNRTITSSKADDSTLAESAPKSHSSHEDNNQEKLVDNMADLETGSSSNSGTRSSSGERRDTGIEENTVEESNIVWWDGPDDPENPMNWKSKTRWGNICLVSLITFIAPLASSMFAPGVPNLMIEFQSSSSLLGALVVSIYVLGFAAGPLILSPLSETYGRLPIYHTCNVLFIAFTVVCAESTSLGMLIGFRFLAGCAGSCPLTIGGGTIADVIPHNRRGLAMALFSMGPIIGPVIGPVGGGFLIQAKGWRWVFWLLAILSGFASVLCIIFMRETYSPVILARKTVRRQKSTGNLNLRSKLHRTDSLQKKLELALTRPIRMLFNPIVFLLSVFMAMIYGYLYLLFTTFTDVFETNYAFSGSIVGLSYVGIGIGAVIAVFLFANVSDKLAGRLSAKGQMKPEHRLPPMIPGALCVPAGLFWYGWTAEAKVHWIVPIIGTAIFGCGMVAVYMCVQTYLVDAFGIYAASALAASTVLRSLAGGLLPLAGESMYGVLGLGWGNSLLGFIALAMCPLPIIFIKFGERIRTRWVVKL